MQVENGSVEALGSRIVENVGRVLVGKAAEIELCVIALLSRGHILIEDVPGVGKTMLAKSLARSLSCGFERLQFTPDLLPSDVTGVNIYSPSTQQFEFRQGPIFTQILLADEINRATYSSHPLPCRHRAGGELAGVVGPLSILPGPGGTRGTRLRHPGRRQGTGPASLGPPPDPQGECRVARPHAGESADPDPRDGTGTAAERGVSLRAASGDLVRPCDSRASPWSL